MLYYRRDANEGIKSTQTSKILKALFQNTIYKFDIDMASPLFEMALIAFWNMCIYIYAYVCVYICIYIRTHIYMHMCVYICIYAYVYIYTYIFVHIHEALFSKKMISEVSSGIANFTIAFLEKSSSYQ